MKIYVGVIIMVIDKSLKMKITYNSAKIELDGKFKGIFNVPVNINEEKYKVVINLSTQNGNVSRITIKPEKEYPIIKNTLVIGRKYNGVFVRKNKEVKNITISIKIAGKGKTEIWITVFPYNEDY